MTNEALVEGLLNSGLLYSNKGFFDQKINLYFSSKTKKYYTDILGLECEICKKTLDDIIVYKAIFSLVPEIHFCCARCLCYLNDPCPSETEILGIAIYKDHEEIISCKYDYIPVFLTKPKLSCFRGNGGDAITVFQIDEISKSVPRGQVQPQIIDNTKLSFRCFDSDFDMKVKQLEIDFYSENDRLMKISTVTSIKSGGMHLLTDGIENDSARRGSEFDRIMDFEIAADNRLEYEDKKLLN